MSQFNGDLHLGSKSVAMTAGEAHPQYSLLWSFKLIVTPLLVFFIPGAVCVGTLVPYTDSKLLPTAVVHPGVGTSPCDRHGAPGIGGLKHVVNTFVMLLIFSAGNSYVYTCLEPHLLRDGA
ncbi:hypothetical protein B0H14DRAFT_2605561 [Mycena olivaceomarginata]|nr:hypothetical protein B0H14DRAFT_2605561 [Mycena olivaceomarginata]